MTAQFTRCSTWAHPRPGPSPGQFFSRKIGVRVESHRSSAGITENPPRVGWALPAHSPFGDDAAVAKRWNVGARGQIVPIETRQRAIVCARDTREASLARLPRYAAPGMPQHVIQRGNNRAALFAQESDYQFYRDCLQRASERYGCEIHAYVFMTNHVHLLMTPTTSVGVARVMQS